MQRNDQVERRLLRVTPGNVRNYHLYIREHLDFFPSDCVGPARRIKAANSHLIELELDGLDERIATDIGADAKNGKPRGFFRGRDWVRRFFRHHNVAAGDLLALERMHA